MPPNGKEVSLHSLYFFLFARTKLGKIPYTLIFILFRTAEKERIKKKAAAQNGRSLTTFGDDGAANSLRSNAAFFRHRQTPYPVFDRPARP